MQSREERRPYNPYPLAGGFAAPNLPDFKTAAVFSRLCAHAGWTGDTKIGIATLMEETKLSHGAVTAAIAELKELKRIAKRARFDPETRGRKTSMTKVACTREELVHAGANDENWFGKGGVAGEPVLRPTTVRDRDPEHRAKTVAALAKARAAKAEKRDAAAVQGNASRDCHADVTPEAKSTATEGKVHGYSEAKSNSTGGKVHPVVQEPSFFGPLEATSQSLTSEVVREPAALQIPQRKKERPEHVAEAPSVGQWQPPQDAAAPPEAKSTGLDSPLRPATTAAMLDAGCPPHVFAELRRYTKYCDALNNTTNVVTAWETLVGKDNDTAAKFRTMWTPRVVTSATVCGEPNLNEGF